MALTLTYLTRTRIQVDISPAVADATVDAWDDWTVAALESPAAAVVVVDVIGIASSGGNTSQVTLVLHPGLTPGVEYEVSTASESASEVVDETLADDPATEWPHGILDALTQAIAESIDGDMLDRPQTILVGDVEPGDNRVLVESTHGFNSRDKRLWVDGFEFSYESMADGAFLGTAPSNDLGEAVGAPALVTAAFGRAALDMVLADTSVLLSDPDALDVVARVLSVPRPIGMPVEGWRAGLRAVAYGARGRPGTTTAFLVAVLGPFGRTVQVTRATANPQRITLVAGEDPFVQSDVGKIVTIGDAVYRSVGPATIGAGAYLELCPMATGEWAAAEWEADDTTEAIVHAFDVDENQTGPLLTIALAEYGESEGDPCKVIVLIDSTALPGVPPHYMQEDASARSGGEPDGGHLLADEAELGSQSIGPYPWYLQGGTSIPSLELVLDLQLVSGVAAIVQAV